MCGIVAVLGSAEAKRERGVELSQRLKHCGLDWSGLRQVGDCYLSHQLHAIIDLPFDDQPLYNEDQLVVAVVNGEIYSHWDLTARLASVGHSFKTVNDCEVIVHLYEEHGEKFVDMLGDVFFVLLDTRHGGSGSSSFMAVRDTIGITPPLH